MFDYISIIALGLLFGSFANVCIYRMPIGLSVSSPRRSFCPWCAQQIKWFQNIPLLSFLWQRARCANCSSRISSRYFFVEISLPSLWLVSLFIYPSMSLAQMVYVGASLFFAIVTTFIDLDWKIIPDQLSLLWLVLVFLAAPFNPLASQAGGLASYENALFGASVAACVVWFTLIAGRAIKQRDVMGWGDVKLMACWGAVLGWIHGGLVFFVAAMLATVWILACFVSKHLRSNDFLPFGPFINIAGVLVLWERLWTLAVR